MRALLTSPIVSGWGLSDFLDVNTFGMIHINALSSNSYSVYYKPFSMLYSLLSQNLKFLNYFNNVRNSTTKQVSKSPSC